MTEYEKAAWLSFEKFSQNWLRNQEHDDYKNVVDEIFQNYKNFFSKLQRLFVEYETALPTPSP